MTGEHPDHNADLQPLLRDIAQQVAARGIRSITGQVVVDVLLFPEGDRDLGTRMVLAPLVINTASRLLSHRGNAASLEQYMGMMSLAMIARASRGTR